MMGYSKELKAYGILDLVKQQIIIRYTVIFDDKNFGIGLLKSSSGSSYSYPFGIVEYTRSTIPPMHI